MTALAHRMLPEAAFLARLRTALRNPLSPVPLLVLRLPEFAEIAWRDGKPAARRIERTTVRAFAAVAGRIMRDEDLLAHEAQSDWFAVAMLSPSRASTAFAATDARIALERIALAMCNETGRRMEWGRLTLERAADLEDFAATREHALVRGARERERFEFLATVGHELRTPLTSIRGYIETVLDDEIDRRTSRRFLETARREALRLARLVEGMLEFSLLDSSSMYAGAADVVALVHGAVEALHPIAAESGVTLTVQADGTALGRIGADACMHALLNVIENGIKYARAGGRVGVTVERQDPFVCVLVDDDGPGVAYADRERIFAYRERGNAPEGVRGAGVGLTIVRTVVERVGGRVHVEVSPAGGARFVVALPLFKAEPEGNAS